MLLLSVGSNYKGINQLILPKSIPSQNENHYQIANEDVKGERCPAGERGHQAGRAPTKHISLGPANLLTAHATPTLGRVYIFTMSG